MKIKDLPNAPEWLKNASVLNEDVSISKYGNVIWHGGDWLGGDWRGGVWHGGDWHGGVWRDKKRIYIRLGYDMRGYLFMLNNVDGEISIVAGCRNFSMPEARAHWGDDYDNSSNENKLLISIILDTADRIIKEVWTL